MAIPRAEHAGAPVMQHRRSLAVSLIVTLALAVAVLIARDQLVTTGEADTVPAAVTATATEIPLVNLVRTADGKQVVVPAGSLDPQVSGGGDHENDDHENDDHEDHDD
jgi:hypothetical protein